MSRIITGTPITKDEAMKGAKTCQLDLLLEMNHGALSSRDPKFQRQLTEMSESFLLQLKYFLKVNDFDIVKAEEG